MDHLTFNTLWQVHFTSFKFHQSNFCEFNFCGAGFNFESSTWLPKKFTWGKLWDYWMLSAFLAKYTPIWGCRWQSDLVALKHMWSKQVVKFMTDFTGLGAWHDVAVVCRHSLLLYMFTTPLSEPQARYCPLGETASLVPIIQPSSVKELTQSRVFMSHMYTLPSAVCVWVGVCVCG